MKKYFSLLFAALLVTLISFGNLFQSVEASPNGTLITQIITQIPVVSVEKLPPEAQKTLDLIKKGGPFPYDRDGIVFRNREKILLLAPTGYYREYTVPTPGIRNRGARRIVTGQKREAYYTQDHYQSFYRIKY
jgi:guanyl-specific ribonuclease Sa